ncbi:MAG: hypothetical protein GX279_09325 [Clostridiaceae bacterium]|nr:hypothetical protein [Clostridiaceae bacterium]
MDSIDKKCSFKSKVDTPMYEYYFDKVGSIKYFIQLLEKKGNSSTALGNITGAPYTNCFLPPAPNQEPSPGQRPPIGYDFFSQNNYPPNLDFISPGLHYKLRPDEAIVIIGRTPPPSAYFSFKVIWRWLRTNPRRTTLV